MERIRQTAPIDTVGRIIDGGQEAKMEILARGSDENLI
jgi:hypothetical protein